MAAASSSFTCLWALQPGIPCMASFTDPALLHSHLVQSHFGQYGDRCHWISCNHGDRPLLKREAVIAHCRSHVPFKAFSCSCGATFKWSYDLKKHCKREMHPLPDSLLTARPGPKPLSRSDSITSTTAPPAPRLPSSSSSSSSSSRIKTRQHIPPAAIQKLKQASSAPRSASPHSSSSTDLPSSSTMHTTTTSSSSSSNMHSFLASHGANLVNLHDIQTSDSRLILAPIINPAVRLSASLSVSPVLPSALPVIQAVVVVDSKPAPLASKKALTKS
ncbi:hypothetical protein BJ741DRAFT_617378 [Chytriomyces cf. hyalinus JEL632]|nr:hypothetical protein BJ741DRAFT_617378 [Chytriomyces cf. hyalinus JEL632]